MVNLIFVAIVRWDPLREFVPKPPNFEFGVLEGYLVTYPNQDTSPSIPLLTLKLGSVFPHDCESRDPESFVRFDKLCFLDGENFDVMFLHK